MQLKILNCLLLTSSLFGYLEWGGENRMFLVQAEYEIIHQFFSNPKDILHPFIIIPLIGQLCLFFTLTQQKPNKILTITGNSCISLLLYFMCFIGIWSGNLKIFFYSLPFVIISITTFVYLIRSGKTR